MFHPLSAAALALATLAIPSLRSSDAAPEAFFRLPSARATALVRSAEFAGKVLFVEVTRTTCPPCEAEAAAVVELRHKYADRGFEVLSVYDELPPKAGAPSDVFARVLANAERRGFEHPIAVNDGGEFHTAFYSKISGTPSAFLISRKGEVSELGPDPLGATARAATTARIEALLAETVPADAPAEPAHSAIEPFAVVSFGGGVIRSAELTGQPTILVAWMPGALMERLGPALERVKHTLGDRMKVLAVTFGDFDEAVTDATRLCPSVSLAAPDSRALAALGAAKLPQILFLDEKGLVAKRISTLYGSSGVESDVLLRIAESMATPAVAVPVSPPAIIPAEPKHAPAPVPVPAPAPAPEPEPAPEPVVPKSESAPASEPASDLEPPPPSSMPVPPTADGEATITFSSVDEFGGVVLAPAPMAAYKTTTHTDILSAADLPRFSARLAKRYPNYQLCSMELLGAGTILLQDNWCQDGQARCGARMLAFTPKGLVEFSTDDFLAGAASMPTSDPTRSTATWERVDK